MTSASYPSLRTFEFKVLLIGHCNRTNIPQFGQIVRVVSCDERILVVSNAYCRRLLTCKVNWILQIITAKSSGSIAIYLIKYVVTRFLQPRLATRGL